MSRSSIVLAIATVACGGDRRATAPHANRPALTSPEELRVVQAWLARADAASAHDDPDADGGAHPGVRTPSPAWCEQALGITDPIDDCTIVETGLGRAAIAIARRCRGEPCDITTFAITGRGAPRPVAIPALDLGIEVILPDGATAFGGTTDRTEDGYTANLYRVELATMTATEVAACAAPTLSPGGRWIVCRDPRGDIYRMPSQGGPLALVHRIDLGGAEIYREPEVGVFLSAVAFTSPTAMHVSSITSDGRIEVDLPWRE